MKNYVFRVNNFFKVGSFYRSKVILDKNKRIVYIQHEISELDIEKIDRLNGYINSDMLAFFDGEPHRVENAYGDNVQFKGVTGGTWTYDNSGATIEEVEFIEKKGE